VGLYLRNRSRDRLHFGWAKFASCSRSANVGPSATGAVARFRVRLVAARSLHDPHAMTKEANFYCGTSGLVLPVPNKQAFPEAYRAGTRLTYYSTLFNSLEVNSSFYKIPRPSTFAKWVTEVSNDFRFTVKLWRGITHAPALDFAPTDVETFMQAAAAIRPRKGCLLIQLPPGAKVDRTSQLECLLGVIARHGEGWKIAVEFRDKSWYVAATDALLERFNAGRVLHDMPASFNWEETTIASFVYLRYHGPAGDYRGGYSRERLIRDASRIKKWLAEGKEVYVYFNNTIGSALPDAQFLTSRLRPGPHAIRQL
jgi:uncharacterized protein YecE (DUF72 family)